MTMILAPEAKKNKAEDITQQALSYLRTVLPKENDEIDVRYNIVGHLRFRINYYKKRKTDNIFPDMYIDRSHYVVVKYNKAKWSHEIS